MLNKREKQYVLYDYIYTTLKKKQDEIFDVRNQEWFTMEDFN